MAEKKKNKFIGFISGYEAPEGREGVRRNIGKKFSSRKFSGSVTQSTKRILEYKPIKLLRDLRETFSCTTAKTYGIFFLSFGILSLLVQFAKDYFGIFGGSSLSALIISAAFGIFGIPLLLADVALPEALQSFRPTEIIFFEFFCIKRFYPSQGQRPLHPAAAFAAAMLLAALGAVIPLWVIGLLIGGTVFVFLTFLSPEFCFLSVLLVLPYVSLFQNYAVVIIVPAILGSLSFIRKAIFGKRVIFFEQYDVLIAVMMLAILVSGIASGRGSSLITALLMAFTMLAYFLAGNIITNRRLADCAINAVTLSSLPAALICAVQFLVSLTSKSALESLTDGNFATFSSSGSAAAFFIVAAIFSVIRAKETHRLVRSFYSMLMMLNVFALIFTGELAAAVALIFAFLAYNALKAKGWLALLLPLLLALPYIVFFLPENVLSSMPDILYKDGSAEVLRRSAEEFLDNILLGIGVGEKGFADAMLKYGITGFSESGNLLLGLGLEGGIVTLSAFLLLLAVRLVHRAYYQRYIRYSHVRKLSPFISVSIFSLLVYASFNYIFRDLTLMYLFFTVFGIASASLRVAKQEHDDGVLYFEDEKSSNSSVVNIHIR